MINLSSVTIPANVTSIDNSAFNAEVTTGEKAFSECPGLTLTVTRGSYAEKYAQENGIPCVYVAE